MRIHRVTLNNFGGHKHLEVDLDAPVACVIGPNGSGKSNILTAVSVAFRGSDSQRALNTFVRRGSDGNGSVEIEFSHGGIRGRLLRQVGKTAGRKLWWDGAKKPLTKDAEISKLISEIITCDKAALEKIVFIRQGDMGSFMFQNPAVRETELAAICQLDHLPAVADIVGQEITRLTREMVDNTAARDEAAGAKSRAEDALRTAESELEQHPDKQAEIRWLDLLAAAVSALRDAAVDHTLRQADVNRLEAEPEAAGIDQKIRLAEATLAELGEKLGNLKIAAARKQELESLLASARSKAAAALAAKTRLELLPGAGEIASELEELAAKLERQKESVELLERHFEVTRIRQECQTNIARYEGVLDNLVEQRRELDPPLEADAISDIENNIRDLGLRLIGLEFVLKSSSELEGACGCPVCGGGDLTHLPSRQEAAALVPELKSRINLARETLARNQTLLQHAAALEGRINHGRAVLGGEREKLESLPVPAFPVTGELVVQSRGVLQEIERNLAAARVRSAEREGAETLYLGLEAGLTPAGTLAAYESELTGLQVADTAATESELAAAGARLRKLSDLKGRIEAARNELKNSSDIYCKADLEAAAAFDRKAVARFGLVSKDPEATLTAIREAREAAARDQEQRSLVQGIIQGHTATLRSAEARLHEIEQKELANASRRDLISQLEEVRGLFGRGGIQRAYLTRLFDILVEETQEALSVWEDDFNVIADPEQPFNFLFSRINRPDEYMDQELLSGGQRLRLSLSFIMGLQRVLYPGLNFMCVDEPSNHMDAEGTEGLVRVFRQIGQASGADSQVLLVDHKPELLAAAGKVAVLPKLPEE